MILTHEDGVNDLSQEHYDKLIDSLDLKLLTCPHCHHTGTVVHAYYDRWVKNGEVEFELIVLRVKCQFCGKTHAILPDSLIPYSSIPEEVTIEIIKAGNKEKLEEILTDNLCLDLTDIYRIRKNYQLHWKERLKSFGLIIDESISRQCIRIFQRQFMQIRRLLCGSYG
jgi:hypothetical protein